MRRVGRLAGAAALALLCAGAAFGAGERRTPPKSSAAGLSWLPPPPVLDVPPIDARALKMEEAGVRSPALRPLRIGVVAEVAVSSSGHGAWYDLAGGERLWRLKVRAAGATHLSLGFSRLHLPEGSMLHIVNEEGFFQGPYSSAQDDLTGQVWTAAVPGSSAVIELFVPSRPAFEPELELRWVVRGFRGLFGDSSAAAKQGPCHIDVACSEGDNWRDEIRSVVLFSYIEGPYLYSCTGTLIRDVARTLTPFILSSGHCLVDPSLDQSVVVYWNFESPACGLLGGGSRTQNQNGTIYRASRMDADFLLLELEEMPDESFGVYYAGWDARAGIQPRAGVGIHHPNADEKAISFDLDAPRTVNSVTLVDHDLNVIGRIANPWRIDGWEVGATESGSSGSALWDVDTHRVVGELAAGTGNCQERGADYYAKFSAGWDGEEPSSRLRDWLDPDGTGILFVNGTDPALPDGFGNGEYTYFVAAIVHSPGVGGSLWRSSLSVLNRSLTAADVTFTYFWGGGPTSAAKAVNKLAVAPGRLVTWDDAALTLFGVDRRSSGSVLINSTQPLVVTARTYTEETAGTFGSYMPGIATSDGVGVDEIGVLSGLRAGSEYRTNVGLVNLTDSPCDAQVRVFAAGGAAMGTPERVSLEGYGFEQIDDVFSATGANPQDEAYAIVETLTAGCRVWSYAAVIDGTGILPGTNDPTTIPLTVLE